MMTVVMMMMMMMMMVAGGGCCGSSFFAMTIDTLGSMEVQRYGAATFGTPNPTIFSLRCMWHPQILLAMTFLKHLEVLGENC